jgi:hypothetical protein
VQGVLEVAMQQAIIGASDRAAIGGLSTPTARTSDVSANPLPVPQLPSAAESADLADLDALSSFDRRFGSSFECAALCVSHMIALERDPSVEPFRDWIEFDRAFDAQSMLATGRHASVESEYRTAPYPFHSCFRSAPSMTVCATSAAHVAADVTV